MDSKQKIKALRAQLTKHKLAGYIQPVHDEYMNEYPPASNQRVQYLTGFAGSAGTAVVLTNKAALFTDGRYTLQAKKEVDGKIYAQHNIADLMPEAWIAQALKGGKVGYDAKLFSRSALARMEKVVVAKKIALVPVPNLVDAIWDGRPAVPSSPVFIHDTKYSGETPASKRKRIGAAVKAAGADFCVLSTPDSIDWLLNIRARDVENTPLALATAIIDTKGKVQLFIMPARINAAVKKHLSADVKIVEPSALAPSLKKLKGKRVLCDPYTLPVWYLQALQKAKAAIVEGTDPCTLPKAIKNKTELSGIKEAHIVDGAAVVKLLHWLDQQTGVTEMDVSDKLLAFRMQGKDFVEPSFPTIAGSGPNGAIVHYRVSKESNRTLKSGELFLLDSGGQYPGGTTDITRTIPIGEPTQEYTDSFTRVLRGHIAIAMVQFPEGTAGSQIDTLARQYLWQAGIDYDHGTGHGVGCFLGVHEGPQRISKRGGDAAFKPGMIVSNEPGYYKTGSYGIRIESLVAVVEKSNKDGRNYFGFETITCAPIDTRLLEMSMLTWTEKNWLNQYHAWVYEKLRTSLDEAARAWLEMRCAAI